MRTRRVVLAMTMINLALLVYNLAHTGTAVTDAAAQTVAPIVRARAYELVDERGIVRSKLNVETSGEVVLRMTDKTGTIRVKLGAGVDGSGLLLGDETAQPGVHIIARRTGTADRPTTTRIMLRARGRERIINP